MHGRFFVILEKLRTGLWPVPLGMLLLSVALFVAARWLDRGAGASAWPAFVYSGSGEDASQLLSTLVSAIITMSSIVFSITIVTLTLAATQFGSRLVRTYMSDMRTKLALGLFSMTILYCMLALRAVDNSMSPDEVPHLVVTAGLGLALACVLMLIFFLHFVSRSIVADEVIGRVAGELEESIALLPPLQPGHRHDVDDGVPEQLGDEGLILTSAAEGYVQAIDYERLVAVAADNDLTLRLDFKAGAFMCNGGWLGTMHAARAVPPEVADALRTAVVIGDVRTPTQDLEFSIRQLVDIALRALSPGINEANTACVVVDRLRGALSRLMSKALPESLHRDASGRVRLIGQYDDYADIFDAALNQIRQSAANQPSVIIELLRAIARIAQHVRLPEQRDALLEHAQLIADAGLRHAEQERDRADIERVHTEAQLQLRRAVLREGSGSGAGSAENSRSGADRSVYFP